MHELEMTPFEAELAKRLGRFAAIEVSPASSEAIAHEAIARTYAPRFLLLPRWRSIRTPLRVGLVLALIAALAAASVYVAGMLPRESRTLLGDRPLLQQTGGLLSGERYELIGLRVADGKVLVTGGYQSNAGGTLGIREAEIYDPLSGRFAVTGPPLVARLSPLGVGLSSGRALVLGGLDFTEAQHPISIAEVFDPSTGEFRRVADLPTPRGTCNCRGGGVFAQPTVLALPDGRAMVAGGVTGNALGNGEIREIELFDPTTGTFRTVDIGCNAARGARVVLADGRVLITCLEGYRARQPSLPAGNSARIFDPATNLVIDAGSPLTSNNGFGVLLSDGRVLLTGSAAQYDEGSEIYDPASGTFTVIPGQFLAGGFQQAFDIGSSRVLFMGNTDTVPSVFDAEKRAFAVANGLAILTSSGRTVARLLDGRLLAVGSDGSAWLINPRRIP